MITIVSSDGADDLHDKQVFNNLLRGKDGELNAGYCIKAGERCDSLPFPCCTGTCSSTLGSSLDRKGQWPKYLFCEQMIVIVKNEDHCSCLFSSLRCLAVVIWFDRRNEWQLNIKKSCCVLHYEKLLNLISRILIICPIDRDTFSFWQICHCHCHDSPPLITAIIGSTTNH